ncbi:MAG: FAD-binding oxidoreductase [Chloroflexi bacterium]|nr:FAD-binding oxidoreductase [Chloroflexota bacterium]
MNVGPVLMADSGSWTAPALPFARMRHPPADLTPPTIAALGAALAEARHIRIVGTQSLASRTAPPPPNALVVTTAALNEIQIEPLDLIARVRAGVTLADLRQRLWEHGLVWPVERLEPDGTVGGLIASGRGSAVRADDAPARRWILGATVVLASGETIHVGGATVKFSAGYGLTHAMWGSGGHLGALAEVTLRLRHAAPGDAIGADARPELSQVLASPVEVRAEELPSGWSEAEWEAFAPAMPRVVSADGSRALIGCPSPGVAAAVANAIQDRGGWSAIDRPLAAPMPPSDDAWTPLRDALDPERALV